MDLPAHPKRLVTVTDIARAAGVSKATAARALGGYGAVGDALKRRVIEVAEALNYRPNELARMMATGRSGIFGLVIGDIENPFFALAARGVSDAAKALGFGVILSNSGENVEEEQSAVSMLMAKRVDGLIVAPASRREREHFEELRAGGLPLVLLDREIDGLKADAALVDNRKAIRSAARLLLSAGHRRLAYLTATEAAAPAYAGPDQIPLTTVLERIEGFLEEARAADLDRPESMIRLGISGDRSTQAVLVSLLTGPDRPTAVIASDSKIALSVFRAAKDAKLSIPRDLSLVTFDDAEWTSALTPGVTVIEQPAYELGSQAVQLLVERIRNPGGAVQRRVLEATLIERESVARVMSADQSAARAGRG